jgi:hypothetical protein
MSVSTRETILDCVIMSSDSENSKSMITLRVQAWLKTCLRQHSTVSHDEDVIETQTEKSHVMADTIIEQANMNNEQIIWQSVSELGGDEFIHDHLDMNGLLLDAMAEAANDYAQEQQDYEMDWEEEGWRLIFAQARENRRRRNNAWQTWEK